MANRHGAYGHEAACYATLARRLEETRMPLVGGARGDALVACALARIQGGEDSAAGIADGGYMGFLNGEEGELASACRSPAAAASVSDLFAAARAAYWDGVAEARQRIPSRRASTAA